MMARNTLRKFAFDHFDAGFGVDPVYVAGQQRFQHVTWSYVLRLYREWQRKQAERKDAP